MPGFFGDADAPLPGHNRTVHRRRGTSAPCQPARRPLLRRVPLPAGSVRGHVLAELPRRDGQRPPAGRSPRPGRPRRAQAAAVLEAPRRPDHGLEPDDRRRCGHRRAEAVDRGRALQRHRLRHRRLRRQASRRAPSVAPGRALPALPARHAPGVHRRAGDRARRLRLPALRAARPEVAALPRRLRDAPGHEPVVRGRPDRTRSRPSSTPESPAPTTAPSSIASPPPPSARTSACSTTSRASSATSRSSRCSTNSRSPTTRSWIRSAAPARTSRRSPSSSRAGPAPGSRSSPSTSSPSCRPWHPDAPRHRLQGVHREPAQDRRRARGRDVQVLPRHRQRRRAARRRHPRRGAPDPDDQHQPLHAREGAHGQGPDRRHPRRQPRVGLLHRRPAGRAPGRGRQHRPDPRGRRQRSLEVREYELQAQFRSNGSDSFIKWVDNTLELDRTPQVLWPADDEFDFRVVGSIKELDTLIRGRAGRGRPPGSSPASAGPGQTPTPPASSSPTSG